MSMLRQVLARVRAGPPGTGLDDIARGLGVTRDEVDAMVEYWVRRGELVMDELSSCASGGCGGCRFSAQGDGCYRPAPRSGPTLVAIRSARDPAR
jgi:hypothetical protein